MGAEHGLSGARRPWARALTALHGPPQIGQAIEEVNSSNQELLRKYRRELQLRKKCHNELVRLKGDRPAPAWLRGGPALPRGPQHLSRQLCPVIEELS